MTTSGMWTNEDMLEEWVEFQKKGSKKRALGDQSTRRGEEVNKQIHENQHPGRQTWVQRASAGDARRRGWVSVGAVCSGSDAHRIRPGICTNAGLILHVWGLIYISHGLPVLLLPPAPEQQGPRDLHWLGVEKGSQKDVPLEQRV